MADDAYKWIVESAGVLRLQGTKYTINWTDKLLYVCFNGNTLMPCTRLDYAKAYVNEHMATAKEFGVDITHKDDSNA